MEENTKKLWLTKVKKGIVAVVESPYAPNNHNCIWLKQDTMYVYGNSGWEELSSSGGDTPEPEPLDPKYVRTPIEFVNFESKSMTMGGESFSYNFSDMISVQEEATEYQEGSKLTWKAPGVQDYSINDTPTLINGDSTGGNAEMFSSMQQLLSAAYPNNTIELVSITDYRISKVCIIIAEVDGARKTFIMEYHDVSPTEGQSFTMEPPTEGASGSELVNPIPRAQFPITLKPIVLGKYEEKGNTKAFICWYADNLSGEVFYRLNGDLGYDYYVPQINTKKWGGVINTTQYLTGLLDAFLAYDCTEFSDKLPSTNPLCIEEVFGSNNYSALHMNSNDYPGKSLVLVTAGYPSTSLYTIEGQTNLTDEQILMDYFDIVDPSDINNHTMTIDLYYNDGMG